MCSQKDLESLVGQLNHACKVVRAGQSFLRCMIDLHSQNDPTVPIRLNWGFRTDLAWWSCSIDRWNGVSFLQTPESLHSVQVASDVSGSWGCGTWWDHSWFQLSWLPRTAELQIAVKELLPIVIGCAIWGLAWTNRRVIWHCDNQVVVACLYSCTS